MSSVQIVPYHSSHASAFRELNEDWITTHFKLEAPDRRVLESPEDYILDRGGFIFVALFNNETVGVCALLKRDDPVYGYELAKMAVGKAMRGRNIGFLLGKAAIEKARELSAARLFLESNTVLTAAIGLYRKLGFIEVAGPPTPYARCNIQMALDLTPASRIN